MTTEELVSIPSNRGSHSNPEAEKIQYRGKKQSQSPRIGAVIRIYGHRYEVDANGRLSQSPRIGAVIRIDRGKCGLPAHTILVSIPSNRGSHSNTTRMGYWTSSQDTVSIPSNRGSHSNMMLGFKLGLVAGVSQSPRIGAVIRITPEACGDWCPNLSQSPRIGAVIRIKKGRRKVETYDVSQSPRIGAVIRINKLWLR